MLNSSSVTAYNNVDASAQFRMYNSLAQPVTLRYPFTCAAKPLSAPPSVDVSRYEQTEYTAFEYVEPASMIFGKDNQIDGDQLKFKLRSPAPRLSDATVRAGSRHQHLPSLETQHKQMIICVCHQILSLLFISELKQTSSDNIKHIDSPCP